MAFALWQRYIHIRNYYNIYKIFLTRNTLIFNIKHNYIIIYRNI